MVKIISLAGHGKLQEEFAFAWSIGFKNCFKPRSVMNDVIKWLGGRERKDKDKQIFFILLLKLCHLTYVNVFRLCTSNFFTDDGCEHAKMKQFTLVAGNIRSQYTLFWKNRWIFNTKLQPRLVTVLNRSFCLETVSYLCSMTISS